MTKKIDSALADADKLFEQINTGNFPSGIKAEMARLQERGSYLRSEAYHRRLHLSSSIFATVMGTIIILSVNYLIASAGMSTPAHLHKALWTGLSLVASHFVYDLWKIWRKYGNKPD